MDDNQRQFYESVNRTMDENRQLFESLHDATESQSPRTTSSCSGTPT
jgi:hypothetical protein